MKIKKIKEEAAFYKDLGHKLYMIRTTNGITRGKLSVILGISLQQLTKYEKGKNKISIPSLITTAKYFNVPLSYFIQQLGDEGELSEEAKISIYSSRAFADIKDSKAKKAILELMKLLKK